MKSKMVAIFATLMIALMVLGISYAMWSKTLYIEGTVYTGEVNADFTLAYCDDTGIDPGYDKDVASCIVSGVGTQTLTVTIYDGYPSYTCWVDFEINNIGTVPVKIQYIMLWDASPYVTVTVWDISEGDQIDAGDGLWGSLEIHVEQSAAELATYSFDLEIYLVQWNEYIP